MSLVSTFMPLNLEDEKTKFRLNPQYNPQFIYPRPFNPSVLTRYGLPQEHFLTIATNYLSKHPSTSTLPPDQILSPDQITTAINDLFTRLNLPPVPVVFSPHRPSRISFYHGQLLIRTHAQFTVAALTASLAHEIQTHYLRAYNQKRQTFPPAKPSIYLRTEEGLAILNSNFYKPAPQFTTICRSYLGVHLAQKLSFSELFAYRQKVFKQHTWEINWHSTLRLKRGLQDTSQGGGFTKDIVYLEGLVAVYDFLLQDGNQFTDLYWGKIATQQIPALKDQAVTAGLIYPEFVPDRLVDFRRYVHSCKLELESPPP
jgi:hypothetical protein